MQLRRLIGKHFWSSWGSTSNSRRFHCRAETSRRLTAKIRRYEEEKPALRVVLNWPDGGLRPPLEDKTLWKNKRRLIRRALVFSRSSCPQLRGAQSGQRSGDPLSSPIGLVLQSSLRFFDSSDLRA